MSKENDFFKEIAEPTQVRTPPSFEFVPVSQPENTFAYTQDPLAAGQPEPVRAPSMASAPAQKDPSLTADIATGTIDALQQVVFFLWHKKRLSKSFFSDPEEFSKAVKLTYTPRNILEKDEDAASKLNLLNRYDEYMRKLKDKTADLAFSPDEEEMFRKPLIKLAELNPNFDLPPGWALLLAALVVGVPRFMNVYQD